jgi:hypothetical protein
VRRAGFRPPLKLNAIVLEQLDDAVERARREDRAANDEAADVVG